MEMYNTSNQYVLSVMLCFAFQCATIIVSIEAYAYAEIILWAWVNQVNSIYKAFVFGLFRKIKEERKKITNFSVTIESRANLP